MMSNGLCPRQNPEGMLENDLNIVSEVLGEDYFDQSEIISIPKSKLTGLREWAKITAI
jgi:hypothetical protein